MTAFLYIFWAGVFALGWGTMVAFGVDFAHSVAALAAVIILFSAARWTKQPRKALVIPTLDRCGDLPTGRVGWITTASTNLWFLLLFTFLVALAGPRVPSRTSSDDAVTLALVVDISASMANQDFQQDGETVTRLAGVQRAFKLLVQGGEADGQSFPGRGGDLVALVTFATRPETACPPTFDHAALVSILDQQAPRTAVTDAATNPGDAIAWAVALLQKAPTRRKAIVLMTDGESNVPPPALTPRQAAHLAKNLDIPIYTIDALVDTESADAPKAHQTLRDVAAMAGGEYFRTANAPALLRAAAELDRLEREAVERTNPRWLDLTPFVALAAFALWTLWLGLHATWWRAI